jgi:hypothetical protein
MTAHNMGTTTEVRTIRFVHRLLFREKYMGEHMVRPITADSNTDHSIQETAICHPITPPTPEVREKITAQTFQGRYIVD